MHSSVPLLFGRGPCAHLRVAFRLDLLRLGEGRRARRDGGVAITFELLDPARTLELGCGHGRPRRGELLLLISRRVPVGGQPPLQLFYAVGVDAPQPFEL